MALSPANSHGGSTAGAAIVRGPFSFAFNTANLSTGISFYTPTVGDILLNVVFDILTSWLPDDLTTFGDVGQFLGGETKGLFELANVADGGFQIRNPQIFGGTPYLSPGLEENGTFYRFATADPLILVVSQNGQRGGTPITNNSGTAKLYIETATPVAL